MSENSPAKIFLYSTFTFIEYLLFASLLYLSISNKVFKKIIIAISILFFSFLIIYDTIAKVRGIDSIPIGVEAILILVFSFYYLYEQLQDTNTLFIYSLYSFWIVLAMMLYLAGSFFIYIYASQLPPEQVAKYWIFTNIFSILKNILFTVAIILNANSNVKKSTSNHKLYQLN